MEDGLRSQAKRESAAAAALSTAPTTYRVEHDTADTTFTVATRKVDSVGPSVDSSIHQIARNADRDTLHRYLLGLGDKKSRLINAPDESGRSALHYAARYGKLGTAQLLVENGADVNAKDGDENTPLHYASRYGRSKKTERPRANSLTRRSSFEIKTHPLPPSHRGKAVGTMVQSISLFTGAGESPLLKRADESSSSDPLIHYLLSRGAYLNARDIYGCTPLHMAATRSNYPAMAELLNGSNRQFVDERDKQKMTALHMAAGRASEECIRLLLVSGADVFATDDQERTPFHIAAMDGNLEAVLALLAEAEKGGPNFKERMMQEGDISGNTALHLAIENGQHAVVDTIVEKCPANVLNMARVDRSTPLHLASVAGDMHVAGMLVERGAAVDAVDNNLATPLHKASVFNHVDVVKYLISRGASIESLDRDNMTPLLLAASGGHSDVVRELMRSGASILATDTNDMTALSLAAENNHAAVAEVLLHDDEEVRLLSIGDQHDETPLHKASARGYIEIVKLLLHMNASLSSKNEEEETPVHVAAKNGMQHVIALLLERDHTIVADMDCNANTPLHLAALAGHASVASQLIHAGANIAARNSNMWTPIDCAAANGHYSVVKVLLESDSPVDPMDKTRTTPLHLACARGHADVVELLIKSGADVKLVNFEGNNCIDLAINNSHADAATSIIKSNKWMDAMRHSTVRPDTGTYDTPLRKLIRNMPEVAELVLDRCMTTSGGNGDSADYEVIFNYELLDDQYASWWQRSERSAADQPAYNEDGTVKPEAERYHSNEGMVTRNHPLMIMVLSRRKNLLAHGVAKSLLAHKWQTYGRHSYYVRLVLFGVFLACLTGFAVVTPPPYRVSELLDKNATDATDLTLNETEDKNSSTYSCEEQKSIASSSIWLVEYLDEAPTGWYKFFHGYAIYYILLFSALSLALEMFSLLFSRKFYFRRDKFTTWVLHISCFIFIVRSSECSKTTGFLEPYQWEAGTIAVFVGWMELILYIRKLPLFGIYVVMFTDVLWTFLRFSLVFLLFIIAFALSFFMIFQERIQFKGAGKSLIRTAVMMLGEFDFDGLFNDDEKVVYYPEVSYTVFVLFALFMPILLMNMMVGLAVDDISEVQKQAVLKRLAMQVELVLGIEALLPRPYIKAKIRQYKKITPNQPGLCGFKKHAIINIDKDEENSREMDELSGLDEKHEKLREALNRTQEQLNLLLERQQRFETMLASALRSTGDLRQRTTSSLDAVGGSRSTGAITPVDGGQSSFGDRL